MYMGSRVRLGAVAKNNRRIIYKRFLSLTTTTAATTPTISSIVSTEKTYIPQTLSFTASDGYVLHGQYWSHNNNSGNDITDNITNDKAVTAGSNTNTNNNTNTTNNNLANTTNKTNKGAVLICGATGLSSSFYKHYAQYLHSQGLNVLTYDYRGIGLSKPEDMRTVASTTMRDWGIYDTEAAILKIVELNPNTEIYSVCNSVGGFCLGLALSNHHIKRAIFFGCQTAYFNDYHRKQKYSMWWKWHVVMPTLAMIYGYFPGKFGSQDLPKGVALEWGTRLNPTFDANYNLLPHDNLVISGLGMRQRMHGIKADILSVTDVNDEFATASGIERLMKRFKYCNDRYVQLDIPFGHVGFFNKKYLVDLWPSTAEYLITGKHPWNDVSLEELVKFEKSKDVTMIGDIKII